MSVKPPVALATDAGQSWKGLFYLSLPLISELDAGLEKTALFALWCLCMAFVSWATVGSGGHKYAEAPPDDPPPAEDRPDLTLRERRLQDIIRRGRR